MFLVKPRKDGIDEKHIFHLEETERERERRKMVFYQIIMHFSVLIERNWKKERDRCIGWRNLTREFLFREKFHVLADRRRILTKIIERSLWRKFIEEISNEHKRSQKFLAKAFFGWFAKRWRNSSNQTFPLIVFPFVQNIN